MKEEMCVSALPCGIIIESILAPPNISAGEPLSNADTRESLAAQHVFTFVSLHVIITCNCCIVLKLLFFVVAEHLRGLVYVLVLCLSADCLPSLFSPPPRQWRFFGKQFEHQRGGAPHSRHNAGTKRYQNLPSAYLHPDSPCSGTDHYHRCSDRYLSHTNLLHLTGRAFVLTQRSPPATVTISSTTPPTLSFQVSHRGYLCFYRDRLMRVKMTQHNCISMQEKQRRATRGALNISTHGSVNLSWFCNISLIMDLIHVYSNSVNYKRKHPSNELHFWIEKWVSSSPHTAAKLGDTKELESFISMLDQELAGKGMTVFLPFFFLITLTVKMKSHQSGRRRVAHIAATLFSASLPPSPPPAPHISLSSSRLLIAFYEDISTTFSDNTALDHECCAPAVSANAAAFQKLPVQTARTSSAISACDTEN